MVNPRDVEDGLQVGTWRHFLTVGGISLFGTAANYLLNEAIIHGKAGPSSALVESQSLWMLTLEVTILSRWPTEYQASGFALGVIGGSFIACDIRKGAGH
jgi:drug/metabolite transporter (DMT)-like permease